ncbi:hypothetical protein KC19_VG121800 [Ceratodon purpureus]|uniref:Uncharacterized protein n=1 Tax=Ceratodon purpureus TaxID=3225 RepID=A0A8T0HPM8_CERPU|nr:hypothetical protein KC19_VG121800 [Ceratodon purpureus]
MHKQYATTTIKIPSTALMGHRGHHRQWVGINRSRLQAALSPPGHHQPQQKRQIGLCTIEKRPAMPPEYMEYRSLDILY